MQTIKDHRALLEALARKAMLDRGLLPDFSPEVLAEVSALQAATGAGAVGAATAPSAAAAGAAALVPSQGTDLTGLLWCSIDNDDSLDLDQLTVAEALPNGKVKILVAVADVDALVERDRAIDGHAGQNTTSVYTPAKIFSMIPEALSTGLTSLNQGQERQAVVVEMLVDHGGSVADGPAIYRARVQNKAKLAYSSVGAWLDGSGPEPAALTAVPGLADNLRLQDRVAQSMKVLRQAGGALTLETVHALPVFTGDSVSGLKSERKNRAKDIISGFMLAANGATARYLAEKGYPSIRRVVRSPERWDRIVELAAQRGYPLPPEPDPKPLEQFLLAEKAADPLRFPDLSLAVVKLLGAGVYAAEVPGDTAPDHFGLAVRDYGHSTAPNRRFTDLVTQRLLKAALDDRPTPYSVAELEEIAIRCTAKENAANKVERQLNKSAAALLLDSRAGEEFEAIVTGAGPKGTWVRLLDLPADGKLLVGHEGMDVGDRLRVRLVAVNVELGFLDFARTGTQ
jgi:exoribonuclease-2